MSNCFEGLEGFPHIWHNSYYKKMSILLPMQRCIT